MVVTISDFLRFSPFDNKINSGFLRQVYAKNPSEEDNIDKEAEFWKRFYFNNTDSFQNTTKMLIDKITDSNFHFILLKGPSGSGKTTYLKQIFNNKDKYFKKYNVDPSIDIINLIENPTEARTDSSLLISVIYDKIQNEIVDEELVRTIYNTIVNSGRNTIKEIGALKTKINSYPEFINSISTCNSSDYSSVTLYDFFKSIEDVSEVIAYYMIFYIFKHCLQTDNPSVFVFDNLDELESKYMVRNLTADIRDAFSQAQGFFDIFKNTKTIAGKYDFVSNCTIIESIRDGFVADVNSCQLLERLDGQTIPIRFNGGFRNSIYEIAEKRIQLYLEYLQGEGLQDRVIPKSINLELIKKEKDYIEMLGKLFNYDYRSTLCFLSEALKEDTSEWGSISIDDNLGIKGLLFFHILKSLFIQNDTFRKYILAELMERNQCNKYRMYMSLLANKYVDFENNEKKRKPITEYGTFSLGDFTKRVRYWYGETAVSSIYNTLFVSDNRNFTLPATLEGEVIDEYYRKKKYDVTLKGLCEYVTKLYNEDTDKLNEIKIVVNPVCSIYAEHIFIHFEYYNLISIANLDDYEVLYGSKSLFQYDAFEDIESCLKRVFIVAKQVIQTADDHVCKICGKGRQCDSFDIKMKRDFCNSQVINLDKTDFLIKNTPYKTRVITSHINYIDTFRKLLWFKYHENNQEIAVSLNTLLLDYINKYITLFQKSKFIIKGPSENIMRGILGNYRKARKKGASEWLPVAVFKSQKL